jgi:quinol monooxygenase YgiN
MAKPLRFHNWRSNAAVRLHNRRHAATAYQRAENRYLLSRTRKLTLIIRKSLGKV